MVRAQSFLLITETYDTNVTLHFIFFLASRCYAEQGPVKNGGYSALNKTIVWIPDGNPFEETKHISRFYCLQQLYVNQKTRFTPDSIINALFYEAGISSHEILIITHEPKKQSSNLAVACFCGLISLLKFFGNEGRGGHLH